MLLSSNCRTTLQIASQTPVHFCAGVGRRRPEVVSLGVEQAGCSELKPPVKDCQEEFISSGKTSVEEMEQWKEMSSIKEQVGSWRYDENRLTEILELLPANERCIRTLVQMAQEFQEYLAYEEGHIGRDSGRIRSFERGQDICIGHLEDWWKKGKIRVRQGGEHLAPGSLELKATLKNTRVGVYGEVIELPIPRPPTLKKQFELAERIMSTHSSSRFRTLEDSLKAKPEEATELLAALFHLAEEAEDGGVEFKNWLCRGIRFNNKEHRSLVEPFIGRIRTSTTRAVAEGRLDREPLARMYRAFLKLFPGQLDRRLVSEQIMPLVADETGAACREGFALLVAAFDQRPELESENFIWMELADLLEVAPRAGCQLAELVLAKHPEFKPTMRQLMMHRLRSSEYTTKESEFLTKQIADGWTPNSGQVKSIMERLSYPLVAREEGVAEEVSMFGSWEFRDSLKKVELLASRGVIPDNFQLPSPDGVLKPWGSALVERMLLDPKENMTDRLCGLDDWRTSMEMVYGFASKDKQLCRRLVKQVCDGLKAVPLAHGLQGLNQTAARGIAVLTRFGLADELKDELVEAIGPFLEQDSEKLKAQPLQPLSSEEETKIRILADLAECAPKSELARSFRSILEQRSSSGDDPLAKGMENLKSAMTKEDCQILKMPALRSVRERLDLVDGIDKIWGKPNQDAREAFKEGLAPDPSWSTLLNTVEQKFGLIEAIDAVRFLVRTGSKDSVELRQSATCFGSLYQQAKDPRQARTLFAYAESLVKEGASRVQATRRTLELLVSGMNFDGTQEYLKQSHEPEISLGLDYLEIGNFTLTTNF